MGAIPLTLDILAGAAGVLAHTSQPERALEVLNLVEKHPALESDSRPLLDAALAYLQTQLSPEAIEEALQESPSTRCHRPGSQPAGPGKRPLRMSAKTAPSLLQIYLFGHLRALGNGERLKLNCLPRTLPLWAYLLLNRKDPIPRDSLAYAFWPDVPENEARANLRRHLYDLRRILPPERPGMPWLLTENKVVQWNPASTYWLDVSEFEQLSAAGSQPERLVEAVQLYGGELLQGVYDDWVFIDRERLRNLLLGDLERLVLHSRARRDYPQAIAYAQQYLLNDPLSEDAVRWLVTLRCESGDRPGALQEYHRFELQLKAELGIPPMPETEALFRALRSGRDTPQLQAALGAIFGSATPAAPLPQAGSTRLPEHNLPAQLTSFVGRQNETALIANLLGRSASPARLLTLSGPGGSGKTRLALEAARHLLTQHAEVFPEGVWFVDLALLSQPQHVLAAIAAVLNVARRWENPTDRKLESGAAPAPPAAGAG